MRRIAELRRSLDGLPAASDMRLRESALDKLQNAVARRNELDALVAGQFVQRRDRLTPSMKWVAWPALAVGLLLSAVVSTFGVPLPQMLLPAVAGAIVWLLAALLARRPEGTAEVGSTIESARAVASNAVKEAAAELGFNGEPTQAALVIVREEIEQSRTQGALRNAIAQQVLREEAGLPTATDKLAKARAAVVNAETNANDAEAEWGKWLTDHDLSAGMDRELALATIDAITNAKLRLGDLRRLDREIADLNQQHDRYERSGIALALEVGVAVSNGVALDDVVATFQTRLAKALEDEAEARRSQTLTEQLEAECNSLNTILDDAKDGHSRFLEGVGASNAQDLAAKIALSKRVHDLGESVTRLTSALTVLSGPGEVLAKFISELTQVKDIVAEEAAARQAQEERAPMRKQMLDASEEAGGLKTELSELETSVRSTELRQEREEMLARAKVLADRVITLSLGERLLRDTRERYEGEHRPAVIEAAENYLRAITGGRYVRIVAPPGEEMSGLEGSDGRLVPMNGLSRGTAEELYFALRLGFIDFFARSGESLPVVMDDVLVNFDPERCEQAARIIEEFSRRHQVLYFTCHPNSLKADTECDLDTVTPANG